MVVIISHFHTTIGPRIFLTVPQIEFTDELEDTIKKGLDLVENEGFVITSIGKARALSYLCYVPSPLARGKVETLLLSCIMTESEPDNAFYEKKMQQAIDKIKKDLDIYKAFYEKSHDVAQQDVVDAKYRLRVIAERLDRTLKTRDVATIGYVSSGVDVYRKGYIPVPSGIKNSNEDGINNSYALIYKEEADGSFRIRGIPVQSENVYKMDVYVESFDMGVVPIVTQALIEMGTRAIYYSGICEEQNSCLLEQYFVHDGSEEELHNLRNKLMEGIPSESEYYPLVIISKLSKEEVPIEEPVVW